MHRTTERSPVRGPGRTTGAGLRRRVILAARQVAGSLVTPLVPADYLDMIAPLRSGADLRARVVDVRRQTDLATTVTLRPGRAWRGHVPGQYIRIGIDIDGVRHWRAYSITSDTGAELVTFTAKAITDGLVSNHLLRTLRPGTLIQLDQAAGDFVLPQDHREGLLFVTAGSGLTPVMGMLRNHRLRDAVVLHSAPTPGDVLFAEELRQRAARGEFRLIERHTASDGVLTHDDLAILVPDWAHRPTWLCGPTAMLDDFTADWEAHGLAQNLHTERFRPSVSVTGEGGHVRFEKQNLEFHADGSRPLLDVGEDAGALMPSGCRMGICFGCVANLREGAVRDLRDGQLTVAADGDEIRIQTCISAPAGDCRIDL